MENNNNITSDAGRVDGALRSTATNDMTFKFGSNPCPFRVNSAYGNNKMSDNDIRKLLSGLADESITVNRNATSDLHAI